MTPDWIAPFQAHINEVNRLIAGLVEDWVPLPDDDDEDRAFATEHQYSLVHHASTLATWAGALPLDDTFWVYVVPYELFHEMRTYHSALLRDLHWFRGAFAAADIETIRLHLLATLRIMDGLRKEAFALMNDTHYRGLPHTCPPSVIVHELCLCSYARDLRQLPSAFQMQDWPAVRYHPRLHDLLHDLVARLWRTRRHSFVHVAVRQTPTFFEIALTMKDLAFRPEMWGAIMYRHDFHQLEILRSIGCEIEPLTWDRGQGEGLVVRLPWATPQGEP